LAGGRYMCVRLDKRCWLEVEDAKHRYAKNLRRYHYEWLGLGRPRESFWLWLDDKRALPFLPTCSREKLQAEVVTYCAPAERKRFALRCE
ncbi:hypothetical protein M885DRAFT_411053, partial [Pelagophyceae sp. CCMP2097]